MCGIIGATGRRDVAPILLKGLVRLEYRGYDSAGVAVIRDDRLDLRKTVGRVAALGVLVRQKAMGGACGIGHTRWATHGGVNAKNAHPHLGNCGSIAVVHNGVIDNHVALRQELIAKGYAFRSDTDTEVIAHLVAEAYRGDLVEAVRRTLPRLKGTYGLAVISPRQPGVIVGARLGSPLVVGVGNGENFIASDQYALTGLVKQIVYLDDGQLCCLTPEQWRILEPARSAAGRSASTNVAKLSSALSDLHCVSPKIHAFSDAHDQDAALSGYESYMLKEIHEQPTALENAHNQRLDDRRADACFLELATCTRCAEAPTARRNRSVRKSAIDRNVPAVQESLRRASRIIITACGTSYHAGLVGEFLIEHFARVPVEVEYASEFRYRNAPLDGDTVVIAISQSGETADTLAALREAKQRGLPTLAVCNVAGSTIAREANNCILLRAGPEIGVASTKAFTSQVSVLTMLALHLGRSRNLSTSEARQIIQEIRAIPDTVRSALACRNEVRKIARRFAHANNFLYLGRQFLFPVALEGALKLKEISYIHAEGYPAAEMKHGPIALVDKNTPSVFLMPRGSVFEKAMSNLEEVKARGGPVIAVVTQGDSETAQRADEIIAIPQTPEYLQPLVAVIPLQLLAYDIARLRGCDVDKPRNLAKSVTVE